MVFLPVGPHVRGIIHGSYKGVGSVDAYRLVLCRIRYRGHADAPHSRSCDDQCTGRAQLFWCACADDVDSDSVETWIRCDCDWRPRFNRGGEGTSRDCHVLRFHKTAYVASGNDINVASR